MSITESTDVPVSRRERKTIETRAAILAAARELIDRLGFDEATIELIAEEADIAPRTFFRYFPSKEALLFAEFDAARDETIRALEDRPQDEDVLESIAVVLHQFSVAVDRRWDEFSWVRDVTTTYCLADSHERALAGHQISSRVAELIANRLGVDPDSDPRPTVWARAIMAAFSQSMVLGPHASHSGRTFDVFIDVLRSTADALGRVELAALLAQDQASQE